MQSTVSTAGACQGHPSTVEELERELRKKERELGEAREQQGAIGDILRVISSSPADLETGLGTLVKSAAKFCGADDVVIYRLDSEGLRVIAHHGPVRGPLGQVVALDRSTVMGRAVLGESTIHIADVQSAEDDLETGRELASKHGHRTMVGVPLMCKRRPVGALLLRRTEVAPFSEQQITLLQTFAGQAAIAIENARLFEEAQTRRRELQEALEYQTATAEVLSVISRSPNALRPVLDAITQTAARLCQADYAHFRLLRDGAYHVASANNYDPLTLQRLTQPSEI